MSPPECTRVWRPDWPCPAFKILGQQRRGSGDPTLIVSRGLAWRGLRTPEGPATLSIEVVANSGEVESRAWGTGASWALEMMPRLLGSADDVDDFRPGAGVVHKAWSMQPHWRLGRTDIIFESLLPSILEQKVTSQEAFAGFRRVVRRFGEVAPGPGADMGLMLQPSASSVARISSWDWIEAGVGPARSATAVRSAGVASALQRASVSGGEALEAALRTVPGLGVWTSAEVRQRALGDPDAVSFGDYHLAKDVGWALGKTGFSDADLAEFLEPWRPHRGRVAHLLRAAGGGRPRRGPRMSPRGHLPVRRG